MLILGALALAGFCLLGAGAVVAESALHPARVPVAPVCPCIARTECRDVEVTAPDGVRLRAWYYRPAPFPDPPNHAGVLLLHGIGTSRADVVGLGAVFLRQGYRVLEPDLRGHGQSEGFTTWGVREKQDVTAWLNWLHGQTGSSRIYGVGSSLGGTVLLESLPDEHRLRAVVAESPVPGFRGFIIPRLARGLPAGLKWLAAPLAEAGVWLVRLRYSVALPDSSDLPALPTSATPVLLIGTPTGTSSTSVVSSGFESSLLRFLESH